MADAGDGVPVFVALGQTEKDFLEAIHKLRENPTLLRNDAEELFRVLWSVDEGMTPEVVTGLVGWLLAGEEPDSWLVQLKENGRSTICGHVFQGEEFVFKCNSCAKDPTSCMCAACFEKSKCRELSHQYQMFRLERRCDSLLERPCLMQSAHAFKSTVRKDLAFLAMQMFRSGGGGCCDCGDHEAWEPAG
ncbi:hypothetical protein T484DRAFT_1805773 [Baffinella frigidus]|nr:hypothetical protein T484DRAFT_1805773 [Cryptophyta sp. CCMP2293]